MPGARCTRGLVCKLCEETHTSIQVQRRQSGIPCAVGFNGLCRALPGDEFVLSPSSGGLAILRDPVGSRNLRRLDTSNGCQDHTTSPSASAPFVLAPYNRSRAMEDPPCDCHLRADAFASTASRPTFVTIAKRPSFGRDGASL